MNLNHIAKWLVTIGALNWGLTGIGMLVGSELNVVNLLLGGMPMLEAIVYVLVGASAVYGLMRK
jgi:uncharacterized membrane protein YuzA (DUF378 family)